MNYEGWFLLRYVRGERFSLHMADLNAAGSLYVLGGIVAAAIAAGRASGRSFAIAALVVIAPAFWLTGSRTALVATLAGFLILAVVRQRKPATRVQLAAAAAGLLLLVIAGAFAVDWQPDVQGSAASSARLRSQFTQTSARMFASAPLFGVGIGKYFDRSSEFMPAEVRAIYGNENAHNYFAQQFAELGIVGGALFLWLVCSLLVAGWRGARARPSDTMLAGLLRRGRRLSAHLSDRASATRAGSRIPLLDCRRRSHRSGRTRAAAIDYDATSPCGRGVHGAGGRGCF